MALFSSEDSYWSENILTILDDGINQGSEAALSAARLRLRLNPNLRLRLRLRLLKVMEVAEAESG